MLFSNAIQIQSEEYIQSKIMQCKPNTQPLKANKKVMRKTGNKMKESDQSEIIMKKNNKKTLNEKILKKKS